MIVTPRLRITPFAEQYLTLRYVGWLNDPEIVKFSDQRFIEHTLASCREYWQSFTNSPNFFWAIICRDSELGHIGNINAYVDIQHSVADVGILVGERRAWAKGYGLEAWLAVCEYLFRVGNVRKITAGTLSVNVGMLKIMERAGMIDDGRRRRQHLWNGEPVDVIYAALFRDDWIDRYPQGPFADLDSAGRTQF